MIRQVLRLTRRRVFRGAFIGFVFGFLIAAISFTPAASVMAGLENWALDSLFLWRGSRTTSTKIILVEIDQETLDHLGKPLMFISPELAEVVTHVKNRGAAAIGIDVLVPDSSLRPRELSSGEPGDATRVGAAVREATNVVLPEILSQSGSLRPISDWFSSAEGLSNWSEIGFVNLTVDSDAQLRRQQLFVATSEGEIHPSFALSLTGVADPAFAAQAIVPRLAGLETSLPLDRSDRLLVNFVGPTGSFQAVPLIHVLNEGRAPGQEPGIDWMNAIVLIGISGIEAADQHATPFLNELGTPRGTNSKKNRSGGLMSGVEIHANVIATLLDRAFITTPVWLNRWLVLLTTGMLLGGALATISLERGAALILAHHLGWRVGCHVCFGTAHVLPPIASVLLLGFLVYSGVFALRWRKIRQMFGVMKSEAVVQAMDDDPGRMNLVGERRDLTVLFSDIRDFTTFSEQHSPEHVFKLLNEYFSVVVPIIESHGGVVNNYMGDGLMIMFGAPQPQTNHADRAVSAALEVIDEVHRRSARWAELGSQHFKMGIGIHTGAAIVGTVGSPRRLDYTAVGDVVNTAARIESANKEAHSEVLISRETFERLSSDRQQSLRLRPQPFLIKLKGKQTPVELLVIETLSTKIRSTDRVDTLPPLSETNSLCNT